MSSNARAARRRAERKYGGPPPTWRDYQWPIFIIGGFVVIGLLGWGGLTFVHHRDDQTAAEKYCGVFDETHNDITAKPPTPPSAPASSIVTVPPTSAPAVPNPAVTASTAVAPPGTPPAGPRPPVDAQTQTPGTIGATADTTAGTTAGTTPGSTPGSTPGTTPGTAPVDDTAAKIAAAQIRRRDASPDSLRSQWDIIILRTKTPATTQRDATDQIDAIKAINDYAKQNCGKDGDLTVPGG